MYVSLAVSAKGISQQISNEMGQVGSAGGRSASRGFLASTAGLVGKTVGIAAGATGAIAGLIGGIAIKGGIEKALAIENAEAKMKGLGNSTETVSEVMANALGAVKGTAFGLGDAANVASTALASGIKPGAEMSKYLGLVADAAATAQVPLGEMGQIMGKVTNSGKVTNDVLNQFGDRGVGVLQMLAKEYGVTAEEMTSMVSKGKVDSETFNRVLTENLGGAALASGDTTAGAFANMKSAMANFGLALSSGFFPLFKGVFNQIQFIFEGVTKRIKPVADAFGVWFQGKAGPIIENFSGNVLKNFDKVIASIGALVLAFQAGGSDVTSSGFNGAMERVGLAARFIFDEISGGIRAFGAAWAANDGDITSSGFPGFMERAAYFVRGLVDAFSMLNFTSVQGFFDSIGPAAGQAGTAFSSIGNSLTTLGPAFVAFGEQLPKITGALVKLGGVSLNVLVVTLGFLADHVDTIIAWMPAIVAGFIAWRIASKAMAGSQLAVNAAQAAMVPLTTVNNILRMRSITLERQHAIAMGQSTAAMNLTNVSIVRSIASWTAQKAIMIAGAVATGVATAAQWAMNAAMTANPIGLVTAAIVALVAIIVLLVMNWDTVVGFLKGIWQGFVDWFTAIMAGFLGWWDGVWNGFLSLITTYFFMVQGIVTAVWNGIIAYFQAIPGRVMAAIVGLAMLYIQVGQWFGSVKDAAVGKLTELVTWVMGLPAQIVSALGNTGALLVNAGKNILTGFLSGLTAGFEKVKGFVGGIGKWIAEHKGPKAYDLGLLVPAGGWIMDGLGSGLKAQIPALKSTLGDVSETIQSGVGVPRAPSFAGDIGGSGAGGSSGPSVVQNIHPAPGMSEETIGRVAANSLDYQLRMANA